MLNKLNTSNTTPTRNDIKLARKALEYIFGFSKSF
jgi:hypothetical protein